MKNVKSLGQNWLKNREILDHIAELASHSVKHCQLCLEIGPGLGTLTSSLLARFNQVIAVEYDSRLAKNLPKSFPGKNLTVVNADFLKFDTSIIDQDFVVAGNIPYYITSPIIRHLITAHNKPSRIVLLIQKEVAEKIASKVGKYSFLTVFVNNYASVKLDALVPKTEFTPIPKVDSQIIILEPYAQPIISAEAIEFAKIGFVSPRKKLVTNLVSGTHIGKVEIKNILHQLNIDENVRPSDLTIQEWGNIYHNCTNKDKHYC